MTALELIKNIDWSELRNQKTVLLEVINHIIQANKSCKESDALNGILSLIDSLQDFAVDELGMDESEVYHLVNSDETVEESFATNGANLIFDELLESDGFHYDSIMSSEFIEKIMSSEYHEARIKEEVRAMILNDLILMTNSFKYDKNVPMYDGEMRDSYEHIVIDYIRKLYHKEKSNS